MLIRRALLAASNSAPPTIITSNLVLNLDAGNPDSYPGTGPTWTDLSGNTAGSTLINGPTYNASGGGSIVFDGINDLVRVPTTSVHDFSATPVTIELWMKTNGAPTQYQLIVNTDESGIVSSWSIGFTTSFFAFMQGVYQSSSSDYNYPRVGFAQFPVNTWTHVIATSSGAGQKGKMYINGVRKLDGSYTTYTMPYWAGQPIGIGLEPRSERFPFKGSLSVVRIYKGKAFTDGEAVQNFEAQRTRYGI
jgi:hypothetical protein